MSTPSSPPSSVAPATPSSKPTASPHQADGHSHLRCHSPSRPAICKTSPQDTSSPFHQFIAYLDTHWNKTERESANVLRVERTIELPYLCQLAYFKAAIFETHLSNHVPLKDIQSLLKHYPNHLLIFHYADDLIDCCLSSPFDPHPVLVLDIRWQDDAHFQNLCTVNSPLELILRLQCFFGKQKLQKRFVSQFRQSLKKLSKAWTCLTHDTEASRHSLSFDTLLRVLFLAFLEARGILDKRPHFMLEEADKMRQQGRSIYDDFMRPFFFGTLNVPPGKRADHALSFGTIPFLNGGLFQPTPNEQANPKRRLPNGELWEILCNLLDGWEFADYETRHADSALDPMMLGHVFEMLMPEEFRSQTGSFYTPMPLVRDIVCRALSAWASLELDLTQKSAEDLFTLGLVHGMSVEKAENCYHKLTHIRIMDIASGSGAFLQAAFECLHKSLSALMRYTGHTPHAPTLARDILLHNLYGVDILETANRICELRLWLSTLKYYAKDEALPPLPNLDMNIRCGHALIELSQYAVTLGVSSAFDAQEQDETASTLRKQYGIATGKAKQRLASKIEALDKHLEATLRTHLCDHINAQLTALRKQASRPNLFGTPEATPNVRHQIRQLEAHLAALNNQTLTGTFSFDIHYSEIMALGGFDILIGNPPWFALHTRPEDERSTLKRLYQVAQKPGHTANKCTQSMDMSALFVEKCLCLAKPGGIVAMLLPNKLFHAPSYEPFRRYIATHAQCISTNDWTESDKNTFDAVAYPADILLRKLNSKKSTNEAWFSSADVCRNQLRSPEPMQSALTAVQMTIGQSFTIKQGIKTAANDLFLCECLEARETTTWVRFKDNTLFEMESSLLYPVLRGSDISPYHIHPHSHIILTHDRHDLSRPLASLPPHASMWFERHQDILRARRCIRSRHLHAVTGVSEQLFMPKVVWRDIAETLSACYVADRTVLPLNTAYYIAVPNESIGLLLSAWLNSTHIRQFCRSRAEHAKNGYRRFFAWLIQDIPWPFTHVSLEDPLIRQIIEISRAAHQNAIPPLCSPRQQSKLDRLVLKAIIRQNKVCLS